MSRARHDGMQDGMTPLKAVDVTQIDTFDALLRSYEHAAFGARALGEAADILHEITTDEDYTVVLTLSGAMTVAKMGLVICEMIERKMVHVIVTTGALVTHGLVETTGQSHFKYEGDMDDAQLYAAGYNRVYDTLELEKNLDDLETIIQVVLEDWSEKEILSSEKLCFEIGRFLNSQDAYGPLRVAWDHGVPVYIPAFTDSEIGLDVAIWMERNRREGRIFHFDPFIDLNSFYEKLFPSKKLAIITIGGGVPRNWAQQFWPYMDIRNTRLHEDRSAPQYSRGIRICPEPEHWGGLSGCKYSEGVSWGKFVPVSEGGRYAEVYTDATLVWPILIKAVMERLDK